MPRYYFNVHNVSPSDGDLGQGLPDNEAATVIGAGSRVEVWDSAAWASYLEASEQAFAEQSEEVVPGLF